MHVLQETDGVVTLQTSVFLEPDIEHIIETITPLGKEAPNMSNTTLGEADVKRWAQRLVEAEERAEALERLDTAVPGLTPDDAYAIRDAVLQYKLDHGATVIGYKLALTSQGTRAALGISEPIAGVLLDTAPVERAETQSAATLVRADYIATEVEPELVFVLGRDLPGSPRPSIGQVLAATSAVAPGLELPDSRFNWNVGVLEMIADNAAASRIALGNSGISPLATDLRLTGIVLEKNNELVGTAAGAAVLGHPAASVAWLASHLAQFGRRLQAGHIIYTGSPLAALPVVASDRVRARFDRLGSVEVLIQ